MKMYNTDSEHAVIGAICIDGSCLHEVMGMLTPESFYTPENAQIYTSILELDKNGSQIDLFTIADELEKKFPTDEWLAQLANIQKNTTSARNIKTYAENVKEYEDLRALYDAGQHITEICLDRDMGLDDKIGQSQQAILDLQQSKNTDPLNAKQMLQSFNDHMNVCFESDGGLTGLSTGFPIFDDHCKGMHEGELIIIAARPAMGKTNFALNLTSNVINQDKSVLFFSLEMTSNELMGRMCASRSNLLYDKVLSANFEGEDWTRYNDFTSTMFDRKIYVDDDAGLSISDIRSKSRQIKMKHGLDLIVVDYLQLVDAPGGTPTEVVENVSRGLKRLAKDMNCPVVALSQLSRECEKRQDKRPMLSDLRQSGSIEQDANIVAFLYREVVYNPGHMQSHVAELIIRKLRHGRTGTIPLLTEFEYCRFRHTDEEIYEYKEEPKKRGMAF
ncbi:MAG: replicative DNA helicase [Rhizobiaceae bacterium]|nr:replicative DNA helicase [Rhizobiaceae bacterium]